jgi:hypothetical protein
MTYQFRALAQQAATAGRISAEEILGLRQTGWADGTMDQGEADAIFQLNDQLSDTGGAEVSGDWADFFVEALTEFVLAGAAPRGFVSDAQANWLIGHLARDGRVETMAELALLERLFDKAERVPEKLKAFALAEIEQTVLEGTGPTRNGGEIAATHITATECALLRKFVFSFAGDTAGGVSQAEAEMLFRIKDATLGAPNAPEWEALFVQGVGNFLMGYNRFEQVSNERAAELDRFMADSSPRIGAFFGRMAKSDLADNFGMAVHKVLGFGRKGTGEQAAHQAEVSARRVTESENAWLQAQVDANGTIDSLEKALLRFIAESEQD